MTEEQTKAAKEAEAKLAERTVQSKKEFDELVAELTENNWLDNGYDESLTVSVSGKLFNDFFQYMHHSKATIQNLMQQMNENYVAQQTFINNYCNTMLTSNAEVTIEFMKAHVENCKQGNTLSSKELNKREAEEKINLKKVD